VSERRREQIALLQPLSHSVERPQLDVEHASNTPHFLT